MYLDDILESMNKIEKYTGALDYEKFIQRDMVIDAVIRNFQDHWRSLQKHSRECEKPLS